MSQQKRILFISRKDDRQSFDTATSMALFLQESTIHYDACFLDDLIFYYDGQSLKISDAAGTDIDSYDGIFLLGWFKLKIYEDIAVALARYAAVKGIPLLNSEAGKTRSYSKLSQCVAAALGNVQTTPFVFSMNGHHLQQGIAQSNLQYPIIVKAVMASRGNDNYLVKSQEELAAIINQNVDVQFIAQTFIPNDGDYRMLVMGDRVRLVLHRQSQTDSHLNNTSQGGAAKLVTVEDLPQSMIEQALYMADTLNRELTGVDMIVHKETGEHYFLEANNMPQLSTGSLVEEKMKHVDAFLTEWLEGEYDRNK